MPSDHVRGDFGAVGLPQSGEDRNTIRNQKASADTMKAFPYRLEALTPWAWHGLAVPSGTSTLHDVVTDTAVAFATAVVLGMMPRSPCLPSKPNYAGHLAIMPFKVSLFMGQGNRLNRPLARRLNLDAECGFRKRLHTARASGNVKDYFHIQEVARGSIFRGFFLHADPMTLAAERYGEKLRCLVIRLGLGRNGVGILTREESGGDLCLNLHTASLFNADCGIQAGPYRLHTIQPSQPITTDDALRITMSWN